MEEDHDDLVHGGVLGNEQALVLTLLHQHIVVDLHHTALLHLQHEPALAPGRAVLQLGRLGVVVKHQGLLGQSVPARLLDHDLEARGEH